VVSLEHVVNYLQSYLHSNWEILKHAQLNDPAFSFLMTLQKIMATS